MTAVVTGGVADGAAGGCRVLVLVSLAALIGSAHTSVAVAPRLVC